jgi:hypothetical protein
MIENKTYFKAITGIIILLCLGLVFFFLFAEPYGDGLEKTMEEADYQEKDSGYIAPLDYGNNYSTALIAGLVGFLIILFSLYFLLKFGRKKNEAHDN